MISNEAIEPARHASRNDGLKVRNLLSPPDQQAERAPEFVALAKHATLAQNTILAEEKEDRIVAHGCRWTCRARRQIALIDLPCTNLPASQPPAPRITEACVGPCLGPDWMPIIPKEVFLHAIYRLEQDPHFRFSGEQGRWGSENGENKQSPFGLIFTLMLSAGAPRGTSSKADGASSFTTLSRATLPRSKWVSWRRRRVSQMP